MVWFPTARLHKNLIHPRRVQRIVEYFAKRIPKNATVLDVGTGDGRLARLLAENRPDLELHGLDVLLRPDALIPVKAFNGSDLPFPDDSFDCVLFVDVLHHADDPLRLLREAKRVARRCVLLKDHTANGLLSRPTLKLMDWVGNAQHGVHMTYRYFSRRQWLEAFEQVGMPIDFWDTKIDLYGPLGNLVFGRSLHCMIGLNPGKCVGVSEYLVGAR